MLITCWFLTQAISTETSIGNRNLDNFVLEDSFNSHNPMILKTGQIFSFLHSSFSEFASSIFILNSYSVLKVKHSQFAHIVGQIAKASERPNLSFIDNSRHFPSEKSLCVFIDCVFDKIITKNAMFEAASVSLIENIFIDQTIEQGSLVSSVDLLEVIGCLFRNITMTNGSRVIFFHGQNFTIIKTIFEDISESEYLIEIAPVYLLMENINFSRIYNFDKIIKADFYQSSIYKIKRINFSSCKGLVGEMLIQNHDVVELEEIDTACNQYITAPAINAIAHIWTEKVYLVEVVDPCFDLHTELWVNGAFLVSKGKEGGRVRNCMTRFGYIIRSWEGWSQTGKDMIIDKSGGNIWQ